MISSVSEAPRRYARLAGLLYLIIIALGLFAEAFVRSRLTVQSDAAATSANIVAHASLLRIGIVADVLTYVLAVPVTLILYVLLKPVNKDLALLAVLLNIVQDAVGPVNALNTYRPLQLLGNADYLNVFSREQLQAMALMSLKQHAVGFALALLFFGVSCIVLGYLIFGSRFLPRTIGGLLAAAGISYLVLSLTVILSPAASTAVFPIAAPIAFVGELSLAIWLLAKGVNVTEWENRRRTSQAAFDRLG